MRIEPFDLLAGIQRACASGRALALPETVADPRMSTGIGFLLHGQRMVAPMDEVAEIISVPKYTRLPGVKPWVLGVANLRGRLLPVYDLEALVGSNRGSPKRQRRVLAVDMGDHYCGLLVSKVFGMQRVAEATDTLSSAGVSSEMGPYIEGAYWRDEVLWTRISARRLAQGPLLQQIAL